MSAYNLVDENRAVTLIERSSFGSIDPWIFKNDCFGTILNNCGEVSARPEVFVHSKIKIVMQPRVDVNSPEIGPSKLFQILKRVPHMKL